PTTAMSQIIFSFDIRKDVYRVMAISFPYFSRRFCSSDITIPLRFPGRLDLRLCFFLNFLL
ncbi:MAG TPA: hypothetical protein VEP90_30830, partial [Methylomirabilota bacterium]|nr:hypothetical protein [Methylomirabilota bacterium]